MKYGDDDDRPRRPCRTGFVFLTGERRAACDLSESFQGRGSEAAFRHQLGLAASVVPGEGRPAVDALYQQGRSEAFAQSASHVLHAGER